MDDEYRTGSENTDNNQADTYSETGIQQVTEEYYDSPTENDGTPRGQNAPYDPSVKADDKDKSDIFDAVLMEHNAYRRSSFRHVSHGVSRAVTLILVIILIAAVVWIVTAVVSFGANMTKRKNMYDDILTQSSAPVIRMPDENSRTSVQPDAREKPDPKNPKASPSDKNNANNRNKNKNNSNKNSLSSEAQ